MTDPVTGDDDEVPPPSRAWVRWTGAVVVVALVLGAAGPLLFSRGDDRPRPEDVLAAAQAALDEQGAGARYSARIERTRPEGSDGTGDPVTVSSTEEVAWAGGAAHFTAGRAPWTVEIVIGPDGTAYSRTGAPTGPATPGTGWEEVSSQPGLDHLEMIEGAGATGGDVAAVAIAQELYLAGGAIDTPRTRLFGLGLDLGDLGGIEPTGIVRAMERLGTAEWADGDTLTATLRAPDEWVDAYGAPLPDGRAELDVGDDGLPTAFRLRIAAGDAAVTVDMAFEGWGDRLTVDLPAVETVAVGLAAGSQLRGRASRRR